MEASTKTNEELKDIDLDLIEPNNLQPRTRFDERLLEELALSIKENGIVQPILVRPLEDGHYQIIAGERRWRAAQRAGLQQIPSVIRNVADNKMLEFALIENIQRQELNPIEEAHAYRKLIDTLNLTQETVAQRVGRDRTFITNYLRLLRLPEDIQKLVEEDTLSAGHARAILGIDDVNKQREVAKNIVSHGLSVRGTERLIKQIIENKKSIQSEPLQSKLPNANLHSVEVKLQRKFGTKVRISPNSLGEGGKIEFHYYNDEDLNRIYDLLNNIQSTNAINKENH